MTDSIFTKIIKGELPAYKIYEDEKVLAILDINPLSNGHTLLIPKVQIDKIYDLQKDDYESLMSAMKKLSLHMEKVLGVRIGFVVEGLQVPHAHIHLVPLYDYDVLRLHHGYPVKSSDSDLLLIASSLRLN